MILSQQNNSGGGGGEHLEVQNLQYIITKCKVKVGRGALMEGIETLKVMCGESNKYPYKAAVHCLLAQAFMEINL